MERKWCSKHIEFKTLISCRTGSGLFIGCVIRWFSPKTAKVTLTEDYLYKITRYMGSSTVVLDILLTPPAQTDGYRRCSGEMSFREFHASLCFPSILSFYITILGVTGLIGICATMCMQE